MANLYIGFKVNTDSLSVAVAGSSIGNECAAEVGLDGLRIFYSLCNLSDFGAITVLNKDQTILSVVTHD